MFQKIHWKKWTIMYLIYCKICPSTEYFDVFLDVQVVQSYGISSYECAECESKTNFIRIYYGSKDTFKLWTLLYLMDWKICPSTGYYDIFLDVQVVQSYGMSSYECVECES